MKRPCEGKRSIHKNLTIALNRKKELFSQLSPRSPTEVSEGAVNVFA